MTLSTKLLSEGDVVKADDSWRITRLFNTGKGYFLKIDQNTEYVPIHPNHTGSEQTNLIAVLDFEGRTTGNADTPHHTNSSCLDLAVRVENAGISLAGMDFLAVKVENYAKENPNDYYTKALDGEKVTLKELDDKGEIVKNGLTLEFYQTGSFNSMVTITNKIGKKPKIVTYGPFVPSTPEA